MVNTTIVSRFTGLLPAGENADRKISGGPLYSADEVRVLLASHGSKTIITWTRKCAADIQKWALGPEELLNLLNAAVCGGRFSGSEWCTQKPSGPWAACDAYSVIHREWVNTASKEMNVEYYIKFAIGKTGTSLLLVSCHP